MRSVTGIVNEAPRGSRRGAFRLCLAAAVAFSAFCGRAESRPAPAPAAEPGLRMIPVARVVTNDVAERIVYDFAVDLDLRTASGVQFDMYCGTFGSFSGFTAYFRSGGGWYSARTTPERQGAWCRVRIPKRRITNIEGTPSGWSRITTVRVCGWYAGKARAPLAVANLALLGGKPRTLVVSGDSCGRRSADERKSFVHYAGTLAGTLDALGYDSAVVSDLDLEPAMLEGLPFIVLPYNTSFPEGKGRVIADYVARGGRILACYALPRETAAALGLKDAGTVNPRRDLGEEITGFGRTETGLPGQPVFAPQASFFAKRLKLPPGARVFANWTGKDRRPLDLPAIVGTEKGMFIGHVWFGTGPEALALMRAIVTELDPGAVPFFAKADAARAVRERETEALLAKLGPKPGERRLAWCHSAWGLGGGHDWDSSIRFLKENGFTDVIANLCWGGMAFYRSDVLPMSPECAQRGDAFEQARAACTKHGVKLHVWKVCWRMNRGCTKEYEAAMLAAGRTQAADGSRQMPRWLCPSDPENRRTEVETMLELARKGADGVHFDYIRYPDEHCCRCAGCMRRFKERCGVKDEDLKNLAKDGAVRAKWLAFRRENITAVVKEVAEKLHGKFPVEISAAVFRDPERDRDTVGQDWGRWCREGWLDFACPMDYLESAELHRSVVERQMAFAGKAKLYPGIGLSCWPEDGEDVRRLAEQIGGLRALGAAGFTVFNFDSRAERAFPRLGFGGRAD